MNYYLDLKLSGIETLWNLDCQSRVQHYSNKPILTTNDTTLTLAIYTMLYRQCTPPSYLMLWSFGVSIWTDFSIFTRRVTSLTTAIRRIGAFASLWRKIGDNQLTVKPTKGYLKAYRKTQDKNERINPDWEIMLIKHVNPTRLTSLLPKKLPTWLVIRRKLHISKSSHTTNLWFLP